MRTKGYIEIYQISQPDKPIALVKCNLRACLVSWERASLNGFTLEASSALLFLPVWVSR